LESLSLLDPKTGVVHLKGESQDNWISHKSVPSPVTIRRITRQLKTWFNRGTTDAGDPNICELLPATIYSDPKYPTFFHIDIATAIE
jgi:hypothetical protein